MNNKDVSPIRSPDIAMLHSTRANLLTTLRYGQRGFATDTLTYILRAMDGLFYEFTPGGAVVALTPPRIPYATAPTVLADSPAEVYGTETIRIFGREMISQNVAVDFTIPAGYSMITGTLVVAVGVTVTVDAGGELVAV